jgi:hypothetical protein
MDKIYKPKITSQEIGGIIYFTKNIKQMNEQIRKDNQERHQRILQGKPQLKDFK